ncbi:MAG TPA: nitrate reductase molybdenum cofactor assembly chaperone [Candidatus Nanopelagicaceae bacterium]|nr:nitrate reductase molybdenum cofactor assembly chaperone [Candidatus Nanopelagicaceae bacterium]
MSSELAATRLAAGWLLYYPDDELLGKLDLIAQVVETLPESMREPLEMFLAHLHDTPLRDVQQHYVGIFDMKRKACPYLTYWTNGDTRNRGQALLRFKEVYRDSGFVLNERELPDHIAVVLEFASVDPLNGESLLHEHLAPLGLMREALFQMGSVYFHVVDAVLATLTQITPDVRTRMAELAYAGPPVESVGLEPFSVTSFAEGAVSRR